MIRLYDRLIALLTNTHPLKSRTESSIMRALENGDTQAINMLSGQITANTFLKNGETVMTQAVKSVHSHLQLVLAEWSDYNAKHPEVEKINANTSKRPEYSHLFSCIELLESQAIPKNEWPEQTFKAQQLNDLIEQSHLMCARHAVFENGLKIIDALASEKDIEQDVLAANTRHETPKALLSKTNHYLLKNFRTLSNINMHKAVIGQMSNALENLKSNKQAYSQIQLPLNNRLDSPTVL